MRAVSRKPISRAAKWILPLAWLSLALFKCDAIFDIAPPEIEIIEPQEGITYFDTLNVDLKVTDNNGVDQVELFLNDSSVYIFSTIPYTLKLDIHDLFSAELELKVIAYDNGGNWTKEERNVTSESILPPEKPRGETTVHTFLYYSYSTDGSSNSLGHSLEHRYSWGDGNISGWIRSRGGTKVWSSEGTNEVKAQARCETHTNAVSDWSNPLIVTVINPNETISTPTRPSGPSSGSTNGGSYSYSTGGSSSNLDHFIEYQFNWDDGSTSAWAFNQSNGHRWSDAGTYSVKAHARCYYHTYAISNWSSSRIVTISEPEPTEAISTPNTPTGPSSGKVNSSYTFSTGGATSNIGHSLEYRFFIDGGSPSGSLNNSYSNWSSSTNVTIRWSSAGTKNIMSIARCAAHNVRSSAYSGLKTISISD